MIQLFLSGGPVMWPILCLSILGLALLLWSAAALRRGAVPRRALVLVSTIITAEPMLGILGTVTGIMQTFRALNGAGATTNPLLATAGIGEALITTAAGLIASLLLLFPYNVLDDRCARREDEQKEARD